MRGYHDFLFIIFFCLGKSVDCYGTRWTNGVLVICVVGLSGVQEGDEYKGRPILLELETAAGTSGEKEESEREREYLTEASGLSYAMPASLSCICYATRISLVPLINSHVVSCERGHVSQW